MALKKKRIIKYNPRRRSTATIHRDDPPRRSTATIHRDDPPRRSSTTRTGIHGGGPDYFMTWRQWTGSRVLLQSRFSYLFKRCAREPRPYSRPLANQVEPSFAYARASFMPGPRINSRPFERSKKMEGVSRPALAHLGPRKRQRHFPRLSPPGSSSSSKLSWHSPREARSSAATCTGPWICAGVVGRRGGRRIILMNYISYCRLEGRGGKGLEGILKSSELPVGNTLF
jgi:hypothetical protein